LNNNGDSVNSFDVGFRAGGDVPTIESVSAFVLIVLRMFMDEISEVIPGNDRELYHSFSQKVHHQSTNNQTIGSDEGPP
jgi:hypothetical protein